MTSVRSRLSARNRVSFDATLLVIVVALLVTGLLSVYSATVHLALPKGNPAFWFRRQLTWAILGLVVMVITSYVPYTLWRRLAPWLLGGTLVMLVVVLFMPARFGSSRFLAGKSVQPSEVAKFTLIVYAASWLASHREHLQDVSYGLLPYSVIIGLVAGLVALQPDLGTAMLLGVVGLTMFFIAGADLRQFVIAVLFGGVTFAGMVAMSAHAQARIQELLDVWHNPDSERWTQLTQALRVMREGGVLGRGPGRLEEYVPAIHHDFILAAVGHAFGLVGITMVLVLFGGLAYRGYVIAARTSDPFAALLAAGLTTWLVLQALINMGVAVALFPPTGIPLPLISYGGSSMLMSMVALGVLMNISQYAPTRSRHADRLLRRGDGGTRVPRPERS